MTATPKQQEDAAIAVAVLFGFFALASVFNFRITTFKVYLLSGLSALCTRRRHPLPSRLPASASAAARPSSLLRARVCTTR